jgi:hypothetical protein
MKTKPNLRNPRTENQQAQRVQLINLVTTYQTLSSFIKDAIKYKINRTLLMYNQEISLD